MIQERAFVLNTTPDGDGPVIYWMDRDMRVSHNWALVHAQSRAIARRVPLIIVYNLVVDFLGGGARQFAFKIAALKELEVRCAELHIPFYVVLDTDGTQTPKLISDFCATHDAGTLVTDFSPLTIQRAWKEKVANLISCEMIEVDAHNIVPARVASSKLEFAAYTIRPKLHKLLEKYLDEFPAMRPHEFVAVSMSEHHTDWHAIETLAASMTRSPAVSWIAPGERAAGAMLKKFISHTLARYASERNDPLAESQSNLSPYLHYGMISAQQVAREVIRHVGVPITELLHSAKNAAGEKLETPTLEESAAAFLEELIVRRELADNFCLYNPQYDTTEGFPNWAQKSFELHRGDPREHVYTREEFEHGETHDDLWNAAQNEMVRTGKMHGYMRMYWAKKILEWTKSPEDAMEIAIYLNDRYELDGRDPNGYAGIAWSIGGVHDRAWFTRPIFGQIRYMARSGCEKKFNVKEYIARNQTTATGSLFRDDR